MAPDTKYLEKPDLDVIDSGNNSHRNPYTFTIAEGNPTYTVTTASRKREVILLMNGTPRVMVCRHSIPGSGEWNDGERRRHSARVRAEGINPEDYSELDSFSVYWGKASPMTMEEIVGLYGPDEMESRDQEKHWDSCFIEEFRNFLRREYVQEAIEKMGIKY